MGTQAPGRKRIPNREKLTAEDDALNQIAREAEARLAAKRAARAEAREIRMKELERQQKELFHSHKVSDDEERMSVGSRGSLRPSDHSGFLGSSSRASSRGSSARASPVVEERPDRDYLVSQGSRSASTLSAATLASLGGALSRRGSCDTSFSVETEASIRDMKDSLAEAEEKYRKAMVSNAQLHNEKSTLMFQVETLREELGDMEELLWEARRHGDDRTKECEHERQAHSVLQFQFEEMRETLRQTEELLTEVSALRLQSRVYSQEISDLQEALQWKEKKIGALERQREISDIVRVERNRLRDEVVRLGDLLKKHGVVVFPGVTTNEGEDDVTAESVSQLAQGPSHGGRESILGKVGEWQTEEGIKLPTNHCHISKWSQSLSIISTSDQTRGDTLKQVKEAKKHTREGKEKHAGAKKQPRNKGGTRDRTNETQDANVLRNIGIKKQPVNQKCELKSALVQSIGDNQAFRGTTDSEASASHQDVFAEKIHKSRLVPPRPVKDIMLDHKALVSNIVTAGKQRCVTQEKQKQNVSGVLEKETSARDVVAQTCLSTVYQEGDGQKSRDESDISTVCSEGMKTDETVPMKDSSEGSKIAAGHVVIAKARSVSGIFEGPSVQVHPQPEDVSVDPSSSTSKVLDVQDPPAREDAENTSSSICYHEVEVAESSEDFNSYFGEPTLMELYASTNTKMSVEVISEPKERREINEMHLKPHQTSSANSYVVEQISKVRRLLRITADEIREMAVPELTVMSLQDGRIIEDRWIKESSGLNIQVHDELSVAVVDSCEEANVEVTQRPATEQQEEEKHRRGGKRFKSQCKIS